VDEQPGGGLRGIGLARAERRIRGERAPFWVKEGPAGADHGLNHVDRDIAPPAGSELERRFQSLVENIPGLVVYLDVVQPDDPTCSYPVYIGPQVEQLLGYERDAWLTEDELWLDVLHPDDRERMIATDVAARSTLEPLFAEYRMIARDGTVVWVSEKATVVRDEITGTHYWQGVMVDITDRRRAEEALAASERQYRSVFDAATIGLMTIGLDGTVLDANEVVERILAYPPGTLDGLNLCRELDAGDETRIRLEELGAGITDRVELEHRLRTMSGSELWCRTVMALVVDASGRPDHLTAMVEDIDARKQAEADLVHRTKHDALTALPNRQHFLDRLAQACQGCGATSSHTGVVFIDIDNFKQVNDTFGHEAGNELLAAIAGRLRSAVRPGDLVARFGGDEFLVLACDLGDPRDAEQLAWRLAHALRTPFSITDAEVSVSASFGVATSEGSDEQGEGLVRRADAAMYTAKERGRNRVAVFGEAGGTETALTA
jgi:diguanylate cyclase (GGDEF)-like protein/PAS domain S-box-containing protein